MPDLSNDWPLKEDRPFKLARIYQLRSIWNGGLCTEGVKQLLLHELSYRSSRGARDLLALVIDALGLRR